MGFVGRKGKDLSLFKINLWDKSAEDWTVLFVSYLFQLWRNVARNVAAFFPDLPSNSCVWYKKRFISQKCFLG